MGYRYYMYVVSNEMVSEIKDLSPDGLTEYAAEKGCWDEDCGVDLVELLGQKTFFEFGKDCDIVQDVQKLGVPLFSHAEYEYYSPYVVGQDAVFCAINDFKQKIVSWYKRLLMSDEEYHEVPPIYKTDVTQEERRRNHIMAQLQEWENDFGLMAIDVDMRSDRIVGSWLYEYEIFELVHQLKIMDWEKNILVFMGW